MTKHWLTTTAAASLALALMVAPAVSQAYDDWDTDADGMIDETNWQSGWAEYGLTDDFDADGDGMIAQTEFEEAIGDEDLFEERYGASAFEDWDTNDDAMLDDEELGSGMFASYDMDGSGGLDETEFGTYEQDIGEDGIFDM